MKPRRLPVIAMSLFERLFGSRPEDPPESRHPAERQAAVDGSPSAHEAARLLRAPTALMQLSEAEALTLVDGAARSASCTASSDVRCAVLTREALEALIAELPATAAKLMAAVAQRLAERLRDSGHKLKIYSLLVQTMQQEIDALMPTPDRRL